jgi:hypothetical protein
MKTRNKLISLVAHVTIRGLESLKRGRIDLNDLRLDGGLRSYRFGWKRLQRETAFCTPMQICERLGVPLIAFDISEEWPEIHPVIEAAQLETLRQLG